MKNNPKFFGIENKLYELDNLTSEIAEIIDSINYKLIGYEVESKPMCEGDIEESYESNDFVTRANVTLDDIAAGLGHIKRMTVMLDDEA